MNNSANVVILRDLALERRKRIITDDPPHELMLLLVKFRETRRGGSVDFGFPLEPFICSSQMRHQTHDCLLSGQTLGKEMFAVCSCCCYCS